MSVSNSENNLQIGRLSINIAGTLVRRLITLPIGLLNVFILARVLDPEGLGQYNLAIFLPLFILTFLNLGVAPANVYYLGRNVDDVDHALHANIIIWFGGIIIGTALGSIIVLFYPDLFFPNVPIEYLWLALIAYPIILLSRFLNSILQGIQNFRDFNLIAILIPITSLILVFITIVIFNGGITGALIAYIVSQSIGLVYAIVRLRHYIFTKKKLSRTFEYMKHSLNYGWKANLSNVIAFLNYRIDVYLINLFLNPTSVGLYFAAVRLIELLWIPSMAVTTVMNPRIAELYEDEEGRQKLTPLTARFTLITTTLLGLVMLAIGFPIFSLLGISYQASYPIFVALMPGAILITLSTILANDLASRGHLKFNVYTAIITFVIEIGLILLLAPQYKLIGFAMATSIAYGLQAFVSLFFYLQVTQLSIKKILVPTQLDYYIVQQGINRFFFYVKTNLSNYQKK